ncbi:MAG: hypothetical protein WAN23_05950 [Candidatus Acidiferrales bacterium]
MADGELERLAEEAASVTEIAQEILKRELSRRKLHVELPEAEQEDEPPPPELVTLRQYLHLQDALLAKTVLDSAGIESRLGDESTIRMYWLWSNALRGVKLWVREEDAAAAASLLDQERPSAFDVEGLGEYTQPRCPECQSMDVTFKGLIRPAAYGSVAAAYFIGIVPPIPFTYANWKCRACGHAWEGPRDAAESKDAPPA